MSEAAVLPPFRFFLIVTPCWNPGKIIGLSLDQICWPVPNCMFSGIPFTYEGGSGRVTWKDKMYL